MDEAVRKRKTLRTRFSKLLAEFEHDVVQPTYREAELVGKVDTLEQVWENIDGLDKDVLDFMIQAKLEDAKLDSETAEAGKFAFDLKKTKARLDIFLRRSKQTSSSASNPPPVPKSKNMLEKIVCKKFSGNLSEWVTWWSQFEQIHTDTELTEVQKFHYLAQAMVPDSPPSRLVDSYPQSSANYPKVIAELKHRYGRPELLSEHYVRDFITLAVSRISAQEKDRGSLSALYADVVAKDEAVKSLNIQADKYLDILKTALIESCLNAEILRAWQRKERDPALSSYDQLMSFLRGEVDTEQKIELATQRFGTSGVSDRRKDRKSGVGASSTSRVEDVPTAAGLTTQSEAAVVCVFCGGKHPSKTCRRARSITLEERKKIVMQSRLCLKCLGPGHRAQTCRTKVNCQVCGRGHQLPMCPEVVNGTQERKKTDSHGQDKADSKADATAMNSTSVDQRILLHTCVVSLEPIHPTGRRINVRVLFDSGAQRSCIQEDVASKLKLTPEGHENLIHTVFGGGRTPERVHQRYMVRLRNLKSNFECNLRVLGHPQLCGDLPTIPNGPWIHELRSKGVTLTNQDATPEIHLLVGADAYGKLLTGRVIQLSCGYTAVETKLGWTVGGKLKSTPECVMSNMAACVTTSLLSSSDLPDLWNLEALGIKDDAEQKERKTLEAEAKAHFTKTVARAPDGRYQVGLQWTTPPELLPSNRSIAEQRLKSTTTRLIKNGLWDDVDRIFQEWEESGYIEHVTHELHSNCHYLPHRAVVKPGSATTKVRPVFDGSCKAKGHLSLNDCLEKGPNLLELIPAILMRFRMKKIGVSADIRKAFLQIEIVPAHRDYLRFLWWMDKSMTDMKIYRHNRVVFGTTCSPFLLMAVLEHHLKSVRNEDAHLAELVWKSLYVDNLVTSVDSAQELMVLKDFAVRTLSDACMDLCQWESSAVEGSGSGFSNGEGCGLDPGCQSGDNVCTVLGLSWDKQSDCLSIKMDAFQTPERITKRVVLSSLQKLFDPLGFLAPVVLQPKLLLQEVWVSKLGWDVELPPEQEKRFRLWLASLDAVRSIILPRRVGAVTEDNWSLHVFCDASKLAYAAVVYLRSVKPDGVEVQLTIAKSRVAPLKKITIPRLELLSSLVGARLYSFCVEALGLEGNATFWTDSTTALAWIRRPENWGTFVSNRVLEIRKRTTPEDWKHVPGVHNPADLPSRGCSAEELSRAKWWEGPGWLKLPEHEWPISQDNPDEDLVCAEKKKSVLMAVSQESNAWYDYKLSSYWKVIGMTAWMLRWYHRSSSTVLEQPELDRAEKRIIRRVQYESDLKSRVQKNLNMMQDEDGIWRLKTKLADGIDSGAFIHPIVLPSDHKFVELLVRDVHLKNCHAGVQAVLTILRERFWVLKARRTVSRIISSCQQCRRFQAKPLDQEEIPLPSTRTDVTVAPFQISGVDLAGPLYLKDEAKVWIVMFTCGVYRAVHLELVSSLSTVVFLQSFRRFVARRIRPSVVYSDQGTNFVGTKNLLRSVDWDEVKEKMGLERIDWRLYPPSSPWWGGWWERLIRAMKGLLVRMLGKRVVLLDELSTLLCEVEAVMNSRPLTYVSENPNDFIVLCPSLFLSGDRAEGVPELLEVGAKGLTRRLAFQAKLLADLKSRFRSEYLGSLVQRAKDLGKTAVAVGDLVYVGDDNLKRIMWPIARVTEVIPGRDGKVRVVKLVTSSGTLTRPVQKLYPLSPEFSSEDYEVEDTSGQDSEAQDSPAQELEESVQPISKPLYQTRSGRIVKVPTRLCL